MFKNTKKLEISENDIRTEKVKSNSSASENNSNFQVNKTTKLHREKRKRTYAHKPIRKGVTFDHEKYITSSSNYSVKRQQEYLDGQRHNAKLNRTKFESCRDELIKLSSLQNNPYYAKRYKSCQRLLSKAEKSLKAVEAIIVDQTDWDLTEVDKLAHKVEVKLFNMKMELDSISAIKKGYDKSHESLSNYFQPSKKTNPASQRMSISSSPRGDESGSESSLSPRVPEKPIAESANETSDEAINESKLVPSPRPWQI